MFKCLFFANYLNSYVFQKEQLLEKQLSVPIVITVLILQLFYCLKQYLIEKEKITTLKK